MKTINIDFDVKSIKNAIKEIKEVQKTMQKQVPQTFILKCLDWVMNKANDYLNSFYMSSDIITDIQTKWEKSVVGNVGTLTNTSDKAVYVEFGVGLVGQGSPHPNSNVSGYEYNVASGKKDSSGRWRFKLDEEQGVDLNVGYYTARNSGDGKLITTQGSPANLYLYNAMMDLISGGAYRTLWQETLAELIK